MTRHQPSSWGGQDAVRCSSFVVGTVPASEGGREELMPTMILSPLARFTYHNWKSLFPWANLTVLEETALGTGFALSGPTLTVPVSHWRDCCASSTVPSLFWGAVSTLTQQVTCFLQHGFFWKSATLCLTAHNLLSLQDLSLVRAMWLPERSCLLICWEKQ